MAKKNVKISLHENTQCTVVPIRWLQWSIILKVTVHTTEVVSFKVWLFILPFLLATKTIELIKEARIGVHVLPLTALAWFQSLEHGGNIQNIKPVKGNANFKL